MNPAQVLELLRIGAQLIAAMNKIKEQVQAADPVLWAQIADDYNKAVSAFNEGDRK